MASHPVSAEANPEEQSPAQWVQTQAKRSQEGTDRRRDVEEHLRLGRSPVGVMKMSPDEGEKFYMEYWQFEQDLEQSPMFGAFLRARDEDEEARLLVNASAAILFRPPFALHTDNFGMEYGVLRARRAMEGIAVLAALQKKDFVCPTGTASCQGIGYPNSCCSTDENCFVIPDTGLGPVGCCPKGGNCGGTITECNAPNTACAANLGGGCCIPNFVCEGVGCKCFTYHYGLFKLIFSQAL
jgi:progranulin